MPGALNRSGSAPQVEDATGFFSRERLAGYDPQLLARASVLVVGAGALGQNTLINLALSGVCELRLVDHDLFEPHNATRSPCYPSQAAQRALGSEKARLVAWRLGPLMSAARPRVRFAVARIQELGLGAFRGVDAVVSCVDNARARAYLADAARLLALPLVEAGFEGPELSLSCYPAARGRRALEEPCWRCSREDLAGAFSCRFTAERAEAQGVIPAIQAAAATLGGLQAEATIMALQGQLSLAGRMLDLNIRTGRSRLTTLATDPACPGAHRSLPRARVRLTTGPDDPVARLVGEINEAVPGPSVITLRDPFVLRARCQGCGHMVEVREPAWKWANAPLCSQCGGRHQRSADEAMTTVPEVFADIDQTLPAEVQALSCSALGLGACDLIEAVDRSRRTIVLRLNGSPDDIFQSPDPIPFDATPALTSPASRPASASSSPGSRERPR